MNRSSHKTKVPVIPATPARIVTTSAACARWTIGTRAVTLSKVGASVVAWPRNRRKTPMFVVNDMPKQIDGALVTLLEQAETATIGHVLYEGFVDRGIAPLLPRRRVAGTAVTLRLPHADSTLLHYACKL